MNRQFNHFLLFICYFFITHALAQNYQAERTRTHDLIHTRLELRPDWTKQHLHGKATITLKPLFYSQNHLELNAKGFEIQGIFLVNESKNDTLRYEYDQRILNIDLGRTFSRKDTFRVEIQYIAKPNELPKGGSQAITSDKGLYFINPDGKESNKPRQLWTQGETEANSCWFPTFDSPNEKMTQEILLTIENGFKTLSNGKLISSKINADGTRTDQWKQDLPHAPYLAMIAAGNFAIVKEKAPNGTELSYYVEPKYAPFAKQIFGRTAEMMSFFEQKTGVPFAWDKYAQIVVRDYVSGAMENTTATVFGDFVHKNTRQLLDGNDDGVIAHELFHHWFGDLVTCESWSNLPLNESFADYAEYLWEEHKNGKDAAQVVATEALNTYLDEAQSKQEALIRFRYADKEDMFDAHSYQKGGRVLHLLRNYVGDEAFWAALNLYLTKNKFQTTEIHDLRKAFESTTGEDLNWFFEQWFMRAGHPELAVEHQYEAGKLRLRIRQTQDSTKYPIYRLPLSLEMWKDGKNQRFSVLLSKPEQIFYFPLATAPDWVLFDADNVLVGRVNHQKTPQEWQKQATQAPLFINRLEALQNIFTDETQQQIQSNTELRNLLIEASQDSFWRVRQFAVNKLFQYDGEDLASVERALQKLVRLEKRTSVRADAIYSLASLNNSNNALLFREALADSSYLVASSGLEAYLNSQPADADSVIRLFDTIGNVEILTAIATYYSTNYQENHYDWYITKLNDIEGNEKHRFLQAFGIFLLKSDETMQQKTVPLLDDLARNDRSPYTRFGGFMALNLLTELKGVDELLDRIKKQETDPQLRKVYDRVRE